MGLKIKLEYFFELVKKEAIDIFGIELKVEETWDEAETVDSYHNYVYSDLKINEAKTFEAFLKKFEEDKIFSDEKLPLKAEMPDIKYPEDYSNERKDLPIYIPTRNIRNSYKYINNDEVLAITDERRLYEKVPRNSIFLVKNEIETINLQKSQKYIYSINLRKKEVLIKDVSDLEIVKKTKGELVAKKGNFYFIKMSDDKVIICNSKSRNLKNYYIKIDKSNKILNELKENYELRIFLLDLENKETKDNLPKNKLIEFTKDFKKINEHDEFTRIPNQRKMAQKNILSGDKFYVIKENNKTVILNKYGKEMVREIPFKSVATELIKYSTNKKEIEYFPLFKLTYRNDRKPFIENTQSVEVLNNAYCFSFDKYLLECTTKETILEEVKKINKIYGVTKIELERYRERILKKFLLREGYKYKYKDINIKKEIYLWNIAEEKTYGKEAKYSDSIFKDSDNIKKTYKKYIHNTYKKYIYNTYKLDELINGNIILEEEERKQKIIGKIKISQFYNCFPQAEQEDFLIRIKGKEQLKFLKILIARLKDKEFIESSEYKKISLLNSIRLKMLRKLIVLLNKLSMEELLLELEDFFQNKLNKDSISFTKKELEEYLYNITNKIKFLKSNNRENRIILEEIMEVIESEYIEILKKADGIVKLEGKEIINNCKNILDKLNETREKLENNKNEELEEANKKFNLEERWRKGLNVEKRECRDVLKFLNQGYQELKCIRKILENPEKENEEILRILEREEIEYQEKEYDIIKDNKNEDKIKMIERNIKFSKEIGLNLKDKKSHTPEITK